MQTALAQTGFRRPGKLGRLLGVRSASPNRQGDFVDFSALRARGFALRRSWDACAACGKVGPVMGLRPLHPDAKSRFTGFGPPSAALPQGGMAKISRLRRSKAATYS